MHSTLRLGLNVSDLKCLHDAELVAGAGAVKYSNLVDETLDKGSTKVADRRGQLVYPPNNAECGAYEVKQTEGTE